MNEDLENNFEEFDETDIADAALRFENFLKRNEEPYFSEEIFVSLSDHYLTQGKIELARKASDFGLAHYPHSLDLLLNKAQLLIHKFELEEATEVLDQAAVFHPLDTEISYLRAVILTFSGEYEQAVEVFMSLLDQTEDKANVWMQIGLTYMNLGNYEKANAAFLEAVQVSGGDEFLYSELVNSYELLDRLEACELYLKNKLDEDPYNHFAWYGLGLCYNQLNLYKKAYESFDYAVVIQDKFVSGWYQKGLVEMNMEVYEKAVESLEKVRSFGESSPELFTALGLAYEQNKEYQNAYISYKMATDLDDQFDEAWYGLASVLFEQEKFFESIHFIRKALKANDINGDYWLLLADNEAKMGAIISADEAYQKAAELDAINPDVWLNWSFLYHEHQEYLRAYEIIKEGLIEIPDEADLHYRAVVYLLYDGQFQEAYRELQEALILDYDGHEQLYEFFSNLDTLKTLQRIIDQFKNQD